MLECHYHRHILTTFLFLSVFALAGCATLQGPNLANDHSGRDVVNAYALSGLFDGALPAVDSALSNVRPTAARDLNAHRSQEAIPAALAPDYLTRRVAYHLRNSAVMHSHLGDLRSAASTLRYSPAAARIAQTSRALQGITLSSGRESQKPDTDPKRRALIKKIIDETSLVQRMTEYRLGIMRVSLSALALSSSGSLSDRSRKRAKIAGRYRMGVSSRLSRELPKRLAAALANVDTATLKAYADLQARPALRWTNQALADAIGNAMSDAALRVDRAGNAYGGEGPTSSTNMRAGGASYR